MSVPLLYIHPTGHLNDLVIPTGALSCMNAVAVPKLGRYAFEVRDDEIRAARVIAMDVHWGLAISGFEPLVEHVRALAPKVPIIVGGVSAGHWARELLERYDVDFVIRGDSEVAFAELVTTLLAGDQPHDIANVFVRGGGEPARRRMRSDEFSATDPLTADWFPTYERCSRWALAAFPAGRTIPVARGCRLRCPDCYGSYASTFGEGYLLRSPRRIAELVREAKDRKTLNLRLFIGKPPARLMDAIIRELAAEGPFHFDTMVGIYVCTPLTVEDLERLAGAFDCEVAISLIPPEDHVPALSPAVREREDRIIATAARYVATSPTLTLDVWTRTDSALDHMREQLDALSTGPVKVNSSAVWSVLRPTDEADSPGFDEVRAASLAVWTFYAARILSPSLAGLLLPFRLLDEVEVDPEAVPCPRPALAGHHAAIMQSWRLHHLPTLPGLRLWALPLGAPRRDGSDRGAPPSRGPKISPQGVHLHGAMALLPEERLRSLDPLRAVPLAEQRDHTGVTLRCAIELSRGTDAVVLLPGPAGGGAPDAGWLCNLARDGVLAIRTGGVEGPVDVEVGVRVQEVHAFLLGPAGALRRGRADLGYIENTRDPVPQAPPRAPPVATRRFRSERTSA